MSIYLIYLGLIIVGGFIILVLFTGIIAFILLLKMFWTDLLKGELW